MPPCQCLNPLNHGKCHIVRIFSNLIRTVLDRFFVSWSGFEKRHPEKLVISENNVLLKFILIHSLHYFPNSSISCKESGKLMPAVSGRKRPGKAPITAMTAMSIKGALSDKTA